MHGSDEGLVKTVADRDAPARQGPILLALALAGFVTALDNNVVNVALPTMQRELGASFADLEWITSSYVLSFASLLIAGGRFADLAGRRRVLLVGLVALVATSLIAGMSWSTQMLITARVAQGAAAAMVMPASLAVLARDVDAEHRDLAAGVWSAALAVALALGPVVGGVLTEHLTWNWIFFLHLPAGLVTMALAHWGLPLNPERTRTTLRGLDPAGLVLATVVLSAVSYALVEGPRVGFTAPSITVAALITALALPALVWAEHRAPEPMLHLGLLRNRVFAGGTLAQILWGVGVNGTILYTSLFLQDVLGFSPSGAGMIFVPLAVVLVLCVPFVPRLVARAGARWTVTAGMVLVALGLALLSLLRTDAGVGELMPGMLSIGFGSALITPLTSAVLTSVAPSSAGVASAMVSAGREASGVLGVGIVGLVVSSVSAAATRDGAAPAAAYLGGYSDGLRIAAVLVLLGGVATAAALRGATNTTQEPESADVSAQPQR